MAGALAMSSSSLAVSGAVSMSSIVFFVVGFDWPFVDERVVGGSGGGGDDAEDGCDGND